MRRCASPNPGFSPYSHYPSPMQLCSEKECVKVYKTYYKLYRYCTYRLFKVCGRCGREFDYYHHQGCCPRCG